MRGIRLGHLVGEYTLASEVPNKPRLGKGRSMVTLVDPGQGVFSIIA